MPFISSWPGTFYADQVVLELTEILLHMSLEYLDRLNQCLRFFILEVCLSYFSVTMTRQKQLLKESLSLR